MQWNQKLYVISRRDLEPGAQAVQGMHAMREFAAEYPELELEWYKTSNHLCFLSVENESELFKLIHKAEAQKLKVSFFREPNFDNAITACCIEPTEEGRQFCAGLPLCLTEFVER